jgi:probable HAF family extracellular repeat protein
MRTFSWAWGPLLAALASLAHATSYELTDLGPAKAESLAQAVSVNNANDAVGFAIVDFRNYTQQARLFHAGRAIVLTQRAGLDVFASAAAGISDKGFIAGTIRPSVDDFDKPFLYRHGRITVLEPPERGYGLATGVNNHGAVIGQSWTTEGDCLCGFIWQDGQWRALRSPAAGYGALPLALNDAGTAVGWADLVVGRHARRVAMRWRNGEMHRLPDLGGHLHEAHGINAQGDIVGRSQLRDRFNAHAFVYRQGQLSDLDNDPDSDSTANAINQGGQVVGERYQTTRGGAFVTDASGTMRYLNDLLSPAQQAVWQVTGAAAINDQGVIVGTAFSNERAGWRAVMLTPLSR